MTNYIIKNEGRQKEDNSIFKKGHQLREATGILKQEHVVKKDVSGKETFIAIN